MDENPYQASQHEGSPPRRQSKRAGPVAAALSAVLMFVLGTALVPGVVFVLDRPLFYDRFWMLFVIGLCLGVALALYSIRSSMQAASRSRT